VTFAFIVVAFIERKSSGLEVDRGSRDALKAPRASSHGGSIADLLTPISLPAHLRLSFRPRRYREIMKVRRERKRDAANGDANDGQREENGIEDIERVA